MLIDCLKRHRATVSKQTMQNIVTVIHQKGIISHYILLTTLNKILRTSSDTKTD